MSKSSEDQRVKNENKCVQTTRHSVRKMWIYNAKHTFKTITPILKVSLH